MTLKQKIQSLLNAANAKTAQADTDLTEAVQTLIAGYGGGGSLPADIELINDGTFTPVEDIHDYTIQHGLGAVPDLVLVYPISGEPTANATNGILIAGRELDNETGRQWYSYGSMTFDASAVRSAQGYYQNYDSPNQGVKSATATEITICTNQGAAYYWCKDVTYRWIVIKQKGLTA